MKKVLSILILILVIIVSCGGKHITEKHFEEMMMSLQKGNLSPLVGDDKETEKNLKVLINGYKKITYKINKVTVNNNKSVLNVTIKYPALKGIGEDIQKKVMQNSEKITEKSEKEIDEDSEKIFSEVVSERLNSPDLKYNEETFDVIYTKEGKNWDIDPNKNDKLIKVMALDMEL